MNPKPGCELTQVRRIDPTTVRPNYVNNGAVLKGIAPPTPTIRSQANMVAAFYKRVAMMHPIHHPERVKYGKFIIKHYIPWILKHVPEYNPMTDDEYIDTLDITEDQKRSLKEECEILRREGYILNQTLRIIMSFLKLEFYELIGKYPRVIMPQNEKTRAAFGAPVHEINNSIKYLPSSIKAIPFVDRPEWLRAKFSNTKVRLMANDFSSFESSCDAWMLTNVLGPIYLAISRNSKDPRIEFYLRYKMMEQEFKYGNLRFKSPPLMRSGDLDTAMGNFFENDSAIAYASHVAGGLGVDHPRAVEGDDSVFEEIPGVQQVFRNLGFTSKLEIYDDLRDASFCRIYVGGKAAITDAVYVLSKLGWSNAQYLQASKKKKFSLLKAKCMSYLTQYAGCPIVTTVCKEILNKLENIPEVVEKDWWEREKMKFWNIELRQRETHPDDRIEYNRLFNVTIEEQLKIEDEITKSIREWNVNSEEETFLDSPTAREVCLRNKPDWVNYYHEYAHLSESEHWIKERFNFRREMNITNDYMSHIVDVYNNTIIN